MRSSLYGGLAFVAILSVGLVLAACGSSSSSTTSTTASISKATFVKKGNAICVKGNATLNAAFKTLGTGKPTDAQITTFVKGPYATSIQRQINSIHALGTPTTGGATVTKFMSIAQTDLNKVKSDPSMLLAKNQHPFADFAKLAHPYGLTSCAKNS